MAFPLFCWAVLAAFLGCLTLFALAVTKVVAPDGHGHTRGFVGTFGALIALCFFGGLGLFGLGATVAAIGVGSAIDWNPIRRIEIQRGVEAARRPATIELPSDAEPAPGASMGARMGASMLEPLTSEAGAVRARFTVRGDAGGELTRLLRDLVGADLDRLPDALAIQHRTDENGQPFDVYEFRLPISERDLERFERDLERELDGLDLRLPQGVDIELGR